MALYDKCCLILNHLKWISKEQSIRMGNSGESSKEDLTLICTLNNYRAQVAWYRDRTKISENDNRYTIDKDIIGNCKLCINCPTLAESGKYSCKIVGREKEKNCFTKTEVLIKGIFYSLFLNSFWDTHLSFFIYFHYIQFYFFHFL